MFLRGIRAFPAIVSFQCNYFHVVIINFLPNNEGRRMHGGESEERRGEAPGREEGLGVVKVGRKSKPPPAGILPAG